MHKSVFITVSLFIFTENVCSLICFLSNFESVKLGKVKNLNHTLKNCDDYNNKVKHLSQELQIPENVTLHCYAVEVSREIVFKGCVQTGGCYFLTDVFSDVVKGFSDLEPNGGSGKIECTECDFDHCNKDVLENLQLKPTSHAFSVPPHRGQTSLNCYHCLEPCEMSNAGQKICGQTIAKSREAVCTTAIEKNSFNPSMAVRRCEIIQKGHDPECPKNSDCTFCKSDLCNKDIEVANSTTALENHQPQTGEASFKCYFCLNECEVSKAEQKTCGENIGPSQEASCTTQVAKETKTPSIAIRKCQITQKGTAPDCPATATCTACKSDLCNSAPSVSSNMATFGAIMACFLAKFIY